MTMHPVRSETGQRQSAFFDSEKKVLRCAYDLRVKKHPVFMPGASGLFSKEIAVRPGSGKCQDQKIIFNPVDQQPVRLYVAFPVTNPVTC